MNIEEIVDNIRNGKITGIRLSATASQDLVIENKKTILDIDTFKKVHKEYTK